MEYAQAGLSGLTIRRFISSIVAPGVDFRDYSREDRISEITRMTMPNIPFPPFNPEILNNLADQAAKLLPSEKSREEVQQNMQILLQGAITRMDLVTREEFDAQTAVLHKLRSRVDRLESQLSVLNDQLTNPSKNQ